MAELDLQRELTRIQSDPDLERGEGRALIQIRREKDAYPDLERGVSSYPDPEREGGPNPYPKKEGGPDSKKDIFSNLRNTEDSHHTREKPLVPRVVLRGSVWSINEVRVWNWSCGIVVVVVVVMTGKEGGSKN